MPPTFFEHPILNSPYEYPSQHWELKDGQPTEKIIENRRPAEFITPIPKPRKRKKSYEQLNLALGVKVRAFRRNINNPISLGTLQGNFNTVI